MLLGVGGQGGQGDEGLARLVRPHDPLLQGGNGECLKMVKYQAKPTWEWGTGV